MKTEEFIRQGATIIDVRTPEEFNWGHPGGSINIPLHEIHLRVEEIRAMAQPLILCCHSGNRSGMAVDFLKQFGIESHNGGAWIDVNYLLSKAG